MFRLADRIIMCPSRHPIDTDGKQPRQVPFRDGHLDVWTQQTGDSTRQHPDLYVLKFPGSAGRAERSTDLPAACWPDLLVEQWTPNPPGYGNSSGPASLRNIEPMALAVYESLVEQSAGQPIVLTGNSLGCVAALSLAAVRPVAGLILRNAPPLREVVMTRFGWKTLGVGAWFIARQIPRALRSIEHARKVTAPALFVVSQLDRIVPVPCQQKIIDAYTGPRRVMTLAEADHATLMTEEQHSEYVGHLQWLWQCILHGKCPTA